MNRPFPLSPRCRDADRDASVCRHDDARIASSDANDITLSMHDTSLSNIFARESCAHVHRACDRAVAVCAALHSARGAAR
jgi:hypothetical protein